MLSEVSRSKTVDWMDTSILPAGNRCCDGEPERCKFTNPDGQTLAQQNLRKLKLDPAQPDAARFPEIYCWSNKRHGGAKVSMLETQEHFPLNLNVFI